MALTDSLIAYYSLNESSGNALDAHGSNPLTDVGGIGSAAGKVGNARDFEFGSGQYFNHADNADLSTGDIDFTTAAWVNAESFTTISPIVAKSPILFGADDEFLLYYLQSLNRFRFLVTNGGGTFGVISADTIGAPSLSTWYFIVGWHDSVNNTVNIQVNNGSVDSASYSSGGCNGAAAFRIGADSSGSPAFWDGLIDEVGFWKRVLTTQERTDLWNGGAGLAYPLTVAGGGQPAMRRLALCNGIYRPVEIGREGVLVA